MVWYYICKKCGESVDNLLVYCEVVRVLWNEIFCKTELVCVMPRRVVGLFLLLERLHGNIELLPCLL